MVIFGAEAGQRCHHDSVGEVHGADFEWLKELAALWWCTSHLVVVDVVSGVDFSSLVVSVVVSRIKSLNCMQQC